MNWAKCCHGKKAMQSKDPMDELAPSSLRKATLQEEAHRRMPERQREPRKLPCKYVRYEYGARGTRNGPVWGPQARWRIPPRAPWGGERKGERKRRVAVRQRRGAWAGGRRGRSKAEKGKGAHPPGVSD